MFTHFKSMAQMSERCEILITRLHFKEIKTLLHTCYERSCGDVHTIENKHTATSLWLSLYFMDRFLYNFFIKFIHNIPVNNDNTLNNNIYVSFFLLFFASGIVKKKGEKALPSVNKTNCHSGAEN